MIKIMDKVLAFSMVGMAGYTTWIVLTNNHLFIG